VVDKGEEDTEAAVLKELKPDGLINLQDEVLEHLDRRREGESLAVPIKYNKNGSLSKTSKAVPEEEFRLMMGHALKKIETAHQEILMGESTYMTSS
jgi:ATP-dependent helicase/nuclease subunit B